MGRGAANKLVIAGAALLVLGVIVGLVGPLILAVLLILISLGAFGMVFVQSAKAARAREQDSSGDADSGDGSEHD